MLTVEEAKKRFEDYFPLLVDTWSDLRDPQHLLLYWDFEKKMFSHIVFNLDTGFNLDTDGEKIFRKLPKTPDGKTTEFAIIPPLPRGVEEEMLKAYIEFAVKNYSKILIRDAEELGFNGEDLKEEAEKFVLYIVSAALMRDNNRRKEFLEDKFGISLEEIAERVGLSDVGPLYELLDVISMPYKEKKIEHLLSVYKEPLRDLRDAAIEAAVFIEEKLEKQKDFNFNFGKLYNNRNSPFNW
jgi:hypothetical protein